MSLERAPTWLAILIALFLASAALPAAIASDEGSGSDDSGDSTDGGNSGEGSGEDDSGDGLGTSLESDEDDASSGSDDSLDDPEDDGAEDGEDSGSDPLEDSDDLDQGSDGSAESDEDSDDENSGPGSSDDDENETDDDGNEGPGSDHDDDAEDDESEDDDDEDSREVKVETSRDEVTVELTRETDVVEDKLELALNVEEAEFQVKFEHEASGVEQEFELRATMLALVEYRDLNGNGSYDVGEPLASAWDLSAESDDEQLPGVLPRPVTWLEPNATSIDADGVSGQRISVPATFDGSGHFELVLYAFGDFVNLNGTDLKPTSVKIDVIINEYPYVVNDTALALILKTESRREMEFESDERHVAADEGGIASSVTSNGTEASLVFAWKEFALVDGVNQTVAVTPIRSVEENDGDEWERRDIFAFSYARGTNITHDPEVFVSIQSLPADLVSLVRPAGSWLLVGIGAALMALVVVVTLGPRMRAR